MKTMFKFRCPACDAGLKTSGDKAGKPFDCPRCQSPGTVPETGALVPLPKAEVAPRRARPKTPQGSVPVRLQLPGRFGGMQAQVTQGTANTLAKTFLGGVLVAIGVALAAFLGGKHKSA